VERNGKDALSSPQQAQGTERITLSIKHKWRLPPKLLRIVKDIDDYSLKGAKLSS
jgi:hypothetical protein